MYTETGKTLDTNDLDNYDDVEYIELGQYSKMALLGLSTIQIVRLQCMEYPFRNRTFESIFNMIRHDKIWMFTRGLPAILVGQLFGLFGFRMA